MDKLKKIFSPGHDKDDNTMYGSGTSSEHTSGHDTRTAGEGSHISGASHGSRINPSAAEGYGADTSAPLHGLSGHHTGSTSTATTGMGAGNDALRPGLPRGSASNASIKSGVLGNIQQSTLTDPRTSGTGLGGDTNKPLPHSPATAMSGASGMGSGLTGTSLPDRSVGSSTRGTTNLGHDSGLAGAAALASASGRHHENDPTRYDTTGTDRAFPLGAGSATTGHSSGQTSAMHTSHLSGTADSRTASGRDATGAVASGPVMPDPTLPILPWTGGHGHEGHGHEFGGDPCGETGQHRTWTANQLDPHVAGAAGGLPPVLAVVAADSPIVGGTAGTSSHHHGRESGLVGAGAAGLGAHEGGGRAGPTADDPASRTIGPHKSNVMNVIDPRVRPEPEKMTDRTTAGPHQSDMLNRMDPNVDSDMSKSRGAATSGAVGGYESSPYSSRALDPRLEPAGARSGDQHVGRNAAALGGAAAAGVGAYEMGRERGSGATPSTYSGTTVGHGEPGYDGAHEARNAALVGGAGTTETGVFGQAHRPHDTEQRSGHGLLGHHEHHEHEEKERKGSHGLLGFLHRDKAKGQEHVPAVQHDEPVYHHRRVEEAAGVGAVGATGVAVAGYEHEHDRNRLHKDPPADHPAAQVGSTGGLRQRMGVDGPIGTPDTVSGLRGTRGNEALPASQEGVVIEPHTGLPMNIGKYGTTGQGGTDGGPIEGFHRDEPGFNPRASAGTGMTAARNVAPGEGVGPEWDAIKKANTLY